MLSLRLHILLTILVISFSQAQNNHISTQQTWFQCFATARLHQNFGIQADAGIRRHDDEYFIRNPLQTFYRVGTNYFFTDNIFLTLGYTYFESMNLNMNLSVPENRPWQSLTVRHKWGRLDVRHRQRLEQRFRRQSNDSVLLDGVFFNWRTGYNLQIQIPILSTTIKSKEPFLIVWDEIFVNFGPNTSNSTFDQNRLYGGLGCLFNNVVSANIGYMYLVLNRSDVLIHNHCIRATMTFTFDARKSNKY